MTLATRPATVLHVNDDEGTRDLVTRLLAGPELAVVEVASGAEALEAVARRPPDLILLAVRLPDLDGFEVCRRLRADPATAGVPVVLFSAFLTTDDDRVRGLEAGADAYLTYPVDPTLLQATVRARLRRRDDREALRAAGQYRALFEQGPLPALVFDRETLRLLAVNEAAVRLYGYAREDLLAMTAADLRAPETIPAVADAVTALPWGAAEAGTCRHRKKDGTVLTVEVRSTAVHWDGRDARLALVQDASEKAQAFVEAEARYRVFAESLPFGIWHADAAGDLVYASPPMLAALGMTLTEARGVGWTRALPPREVDRLLAAWRQSCEAGRPWDYEYQLVDADGRDHTVLSRAVPVRDDAGRVTGWVGVNLDITERKRIERELDLLLASEHAARDEAEAASRAKDEFMAVLSHELRTPLTALLGWIHMLRSGRLGAEQQAAALESIERNTRLQAQLVGDLLDVSRIIAGKLVVERRRVDLPTIARRAVEAAQPAASAKGVTIDVQVGAGIPAMVGDPLRLQQIVGNLLSNAVKFTAAGGAVHVALDAHEQSVRVRVQDTGRGIHPELLPRIFDRFRQADSSPRRAEGGLGLGLAIVRALTEIHGGTVRAKSAGPGTGATFVVELPLGAVPAPEEPGPPAPPARLDGLRVLLVEDHDDTRRLVGMLLEEHGARVTAARSGAAALPLLGAASFDVLVTDLGMPDVDGYALLAAIRATWSGQRLPAVALTAYVRDSDRERVRAAGFDAHVGKPIDPAELAATVARVAGRAASG